MKALSQKREDRFTSVNEMIAIIGRWLDGTRKHELAMNAVELARSYQPEIEAAEVSATALREQADNLRTKVNSWVIEETKLKLWNLEDEAKILEARARLLRVKDSGVSNGAGAKIKSRSRSRCFHSLQRYSRTGGTAGLARNSATEINEGTRRFTARPSSARINCSDT